MQSQFNIGLRNQDNKITSRCNFKAVTEAQILSQNLSFSPINYDIFTAYFPTLNASVQKCTKQITNVQGFLAQLKGNPENL